LLALFARLRRVRCDDAPRDRPAVRADRVALSRTQLRPALPAVDLAWLHPRLAALALFDVKLVNGFARREQVGVDVWLQVPTNNVLAAGGNGDDSLMPAITGLVDAVVALVTAGPIKPNFAGHVDVNAPHNDQLARTHSGHQLQLDHRGDLGADVGH